MRIFSAPPRFFCAACPIYPHRCAQPLPIYAQFLLFLWTSTDFYVGVYFSAKASILAASVPPPAVRAAPPAR